MKKPAKSPIVLTLIAFLSNSVSLTASAYETIYHPTEASPSDIAADFAAELGLEAPDPSAAEKPSRDRVVRPEDFGKYRLSVDIFRASKKRPVLGKWNDEYVDATNSTFTSKDPAQRAAQGKKRYLTLASREFAVLSIDGVPVKAYLISGASETERNLPVTEIKGGKRVKKLEVERDAVTGQPVTDPVTGRAKVRPVMKVEKKTTPNGAFKLTPRTYPKVPVGSPRGTPRVDMVDPFPLSGTYDLSTMYWGLSIFGGYLIHSTPHYGELGRPASMGCIRQSYPDAMELFDLVTNRFGEGMIRIHKMDSVAAVNRLREIFYDPTFAPKFTDAQLADPATLPTYASASAPRDMKWLVERLNVSYQNLENFKKFNRSGEYDGLGHTWIDPATKRPEGDPVFPKCGAYDCFAEWGDPTKKRQDRLKQKREQDAETEEAETERLLQELEAASVSGL